MKRLFIIVFLLCIKECYCQKKLSVKQIDNAIHEEKKCDYILDSNLNDVDSSLSAFKILYCLDPSTKILLVAKVFLDEKNKTLMQYKYFFINERLAKVDFLLKGSLNCFGHYYFNNNHLLYKEEKNIQVQNAETFLKAATILISNARKRRKK